MNQYLIVYEKFFDKCHTSPGGGVYFSKEFIQDFFEGCLKYKIFIIGFEGFIDKDTGIMPHLGCIEDYSWLWEKRDHYSSWDLLVQESINLAQNNIIECLKECDVFTFTLFDEKQS